MTRGLLAGILLGAGCVPNDAFRRVPHYRQTQVDVGLTRATDTVGFDGLGRAGALAPAATVVSPAPAAPTPAHDSAYHQRGLRYQLTCFAKTALASPGITVGTVIVAPVDRDDAFPCD